MTTVTPELSATIASLISERRIARAVRALRDVPANDPGYPELAAQLAHAGAVLTLSRDAQRQLVERAVDHGGTVAFALSATEPFGHGDPWAAVARIALRMLSDGRQPDAVRGAGWLWFAVLLDQAGSAHAPAALQAATQAVERGLAYRVGVRVGLVPSPVDAFDMRGALTDLLDWLERAELRLQPAADAVEYRDDALGRYACAYLASVAEPKLEPATVLDPATGAAVSHPHRTSYSAQVARAPHDPLVEAILYRLAGIAGLPENHLEPLAVLRYEPGQEYKPHGDWLPADTADDLSHLAQYGQRTHTVLVYLNTPAGGGALAFPELDLTIEARAGRVVCFRNTDADGRPLKSSLHASVPVTDGEKWTASLWFRSRPVAG